VFLARQGRTAEAAAHLREALRLEPSHSDARANLEKLVGPGK
jgi:Flp pilus assembly protein TadD